MNNQASQASSVVEIPTRRCMHDVYRPYRAYRVHRARQHEVTIWFECVDCSEPLVELERFDSKEEAERRYWDAINAMVHEDRRVSETSAPARKQPLNFEAPQQVLLT